LNAKLKVSQIKPMKSYFFLIILSLCIVSNLQAQSSKDLAEAYKSNIPLHQEIVSGGYYVDPPQSIEGDPYFKTKNFKYGTISINGLSYENIPLLYNIYTDQIVTFHPLHKQKTLIKTEKIDGFVFLDKSRFVRINENPEYIHHKNGFYELEKEGNANLLVKYFKTAKPNMQISKYSSTFTEKSDFFIQKSNSMHLVKSRGKSIWFLGLDKKEIKRSTKERGLNFKNDRRAYLSFLVESYNQSENE